MYTETPIVKYNHGRRVDGQCVCLMVPCPQRQQAAIHCLDYLRMRDLNYLQC